MDIKNKKFVSFAILTGLIFLLASSWFYFYSSQSVVDEEFHGILQERVQQALSNYIERKRPDIHQIVFHKVWTENTSNPNQVKVFFSYTLITDEGNTGGEFSMESEAYLTRESGKSDNWLLSDFQVTESLLDFSEPIPVKASEIKDSE